MNFASLIYALLAGLIPSLLWLFFWLREDNLHPEPRGVLALCFIAGCISVIIAIVLEKWTQGFIADTNIRYLVWAAIEELLKFGSVAVLVFRSDVLDEPIDVMIYCITVALGFAALENALFILTPLHLGEFSASIITGNLRFMGATLVHVVSSAIIGFTAGLAFYRNWISKTFSILTGILIAIALHTSFNLAIMYGTATNTLRTFGWVWCAVVILIILFEEIKVVHAK